MGGSNYGKLSTSLFGKLALGQPNERYFIIDYIPGSNTTRIPCNLFIEAPETRRNFIPPFSHYKLPYPNDFFADGRMDMVMDFLSPNACLGVLREIKRCLCQGGIFTFVDAIENKKMALYTAYALRFHIVQLLNHSELLSAHYELSKTAADFDKQEHDLFLMTVQK